MTDNSRKVFDFLKDNHDVATITAQEIAKELDISVSAVTGSVNGLVKKGLAVRTEDSVTEGEGEKAKAKVVKYIALTDAGMAFDPDAKAEKE